VNDAISKLLSISSAPIVLSQAEAEPLGSLLTGLGRTAEQLVSLLGVKNGFVAFENALVVFPRCGGKLIPGLKQWNSLTGWRRYYLSVAPESIVFFAEDAFANQFGLDRAGVARLDPESGALTRHSASVEHWAAKVLENYDFETGWSVAKKWQVANGPLGLSKKLIGKTPFILGGDYVPENLMAVERSAAMEALGRLFNQIKSAPEGTRVTVDGWPESK
jgi:hypothetical protein